MQSQLITFGTAFTASGAAVLSGQSEAAHPRASSFFLGHIYDPMFLCCLGTLQALTTFTTWHPQEKNQQSLFSHLCLEVRLVFKFTGV